MSLPLGSSIEDSLRLSLFGGAAFKPGPVEFCFTFPSTSSKGRDEAALTGFGSLEGWVGYGIAKQYGWLSACNIFMWEGWNMCKYKLDVYGFGERRTAFALIRRRGS